MRLFQFAALLATVLLTLSSAAGAVTLKRGNQNEPDTLDPHRATGSWENNIIGDMILGLMTEDAAGNPIYGAAESHTVSEDGRVYTFKIREGHVWSDGVPVTAGDFVFGMRRILDPAFGAEYASILYPIKGAAELNAGTAAPETLAVKAIDARTLEIALVNPAPYFLQLLTHYAAWGVPKHAVEANPTGWTKPGVMVSNGPYVLAEWSPGDHVKLVKNPLFYDADNVAIDEVYFFPTDDGEAALKRFRAGELDINIGIPSQKLDYARSELAAETRISVVLNTRYITINTSCAPFDDARVRAALSLAIDRPTIAEKILRAGEQPAYSLVPPGIADYPGTARFPYAGQPLEQRVAEAKRLLAEAGFGPDNPLAFKFNYIADPDSRRVAVALGQMWQAIGANADLVLSEKKVHYNTVRVRDYEVAEANWFADYNDAKNFLFLAQPSSGAMNTSAYANMEYENLIAQSDATSDAAARAALLTKAEQLMLDEHPLAPLYFGVNRALIGKHVEGWVDNIVNVHRTRFLRIKTAATR